MQLWYSIVACFTVSSVVAQSPQSLPFEDYVRAQTQASLYGILNNTYGVNSSFPGVIIASPATDTARPGESGGQNYYYQWARDASLTIKTIINQYASGDTSLGPFIKAYIDNERVLQRLDTKSGNFSTGGLGEPKFYVNSTAFNEHWGRPQSDGPALRAIAIMGFLSLQNDTAYIKNVTDTVVKPDLDYVATQWNEPGFDLWEEQEDLHFFTAMAQARALREGAILMSKAGDNSSARIYIEEEAKLSTLIDSFWNSTGTGTFDAQLNLTKPTGADCANLLASIHNTDANAKYRPSSDRILASASTLLDEMTGLYSIDANRNSSAIAVGRYASDVYDGIQTSQANPWFLCNSAVAETLYLAATELNATGTASVNDVNVNFFRRIDSSSSIGSNFTGANLSSLLSKMRNLGDEFLKIEQIYVTQNFSMSEQINKTTGIQQGARDLTWSYAAFVSAARARSGQLTYNFTTGHSSNILSYTMPANDNVTVLISNASAAESSSSALGYPLALALSAIFLYAF